MLGNLSFWHLLVVAIVGLMVFGPDRLPQAAADAARMLRRVRRLAHDATAELRTELGPELGDLALAATRPGEMLRRALLDDDVTAPPPAGGGVHSLAPGERPPYDVEAT